jgi:hypothetical protein
MAESKEELELQLLRAQIRLAERQQSSWLASAGGAAAGIVTSVVASLIIAAMVYSFGEGWVASLFQRRA